MYQKVPELSNYLLYVLVVYRTALGELSMPSFEQKISKMPDGVFKDINVFLIWAMWCISTFFMFVIMTNFNIAQITSTYNRTKELEKMIAYQHKADLNLETAMLIDVFQKMPSYRCILFACSKSSAATENDALDQNIYLLRKFIKKGNDEIYDKNFRVQEQLDSVHAKQQEL